MKKIILSSLISLMLGIAIALFGINVVNTDLTESLSDALTETSLSNDYSSFLLTSSVLKELEKGNKEEALLILRLSQQDHVSQLIEEYTKANEEWKTKVDKLFESFIEIKSKENKFNPNVNKVDKIIYEHVKKHNKSFNLTVLYAVSLRSTLYKTAG